MFPTRFFKSKFKKALGNSRSQSSRKYGMDDIEIKHRV
jgi:hypothetical protein